MKHVRLACRLASVAWFAFFIIFLASGARLASERSLRPSVLLEAPSIITLSTHHLPVLVGKSREVRIAFAGSPVHVPDDVLAG